MCAIPLKALRENQLIPLATAPTQDQGSHQTIKASFQESGKTFEGFYKKLAPEKDYPELLAKISVATSLFKRLFQGKLSAEERLVFNDSDELTGTFSVNIEGFKPFNYAYEPVPTDSSEQERVIPRTATLIKKNTIELLLGRWFLDDDDAHPHNISLEGDIDFDMFFYWFTILMKTPRLLIGIRKTHINLTIKAWESFPVNPESGTYHWPTYEHPGETTIPAYLPGQILNKTLPKIYADPLQFKNLAAEPQAQEQKLFAALKILITYQPRLIKNHLQTLFGDMPLNYTSLESISKELPLNYETTFPELCNPSTNNKPFVDFIMQLYQEHYDNLYRIVIFHMGCKNNGHGVTLPATWEALYTNPSIFKNIESWVIQQNASLLAKEDSSLQYNLQELNQRYHQVWRDAFAPTVKNMLYDSYHLSQTLFKIASTTATEPGVLSGKQPSDATLTDAWQLVGTMPRLPTEQMASLICLDKDSDLRKAWIELATFYQSLNTTCNNYYIKAREDLTEEDNLTFCQQLNHLHGHYNLLLRKQLAHTTSYANSFSRIASCLEQIARQANFQIHLISTDDQIRSSVSFSIKQEFLPHTHEIVMDQFNNYLFLWAKELRVEVFERHIKDIIDKYYVSMLSNRYREMPVKNYLSTSRETPGNQRLAYIFSSGLEDTGALNTLLIEHLTPQMLQSHPIPGISAALSNNTFQNSLALYTKSVVHFSKNDPQFIHLYSHQGMELFFKTFYDWAEASTHFNVLMQTALADYEKGLTWAWSVSRKKEVLEYRKAQNSQATILGLIFMHGNDNSSLNVQVFQKFINAIKIEIADNPAMLKDTGYQLIQDFIFTEHQTYYFREIKKHTTQLLDIEASSTLSKSTLLSS